MYRVMSPTIAGGFTPTEITVSKRILEEIHAASDPAAHPHDPCGGRHEYKVGFLNFATASSLNSHS